MSNHIPSIKLVVLGESSVGKSSIVTRYVENTFMNKRDPTIGAELSTKIYSIETHDIKFVIWDTAGQERFHALAPMYYRNALAAMVVFDVTNYNTYEKAKEWIIELKNQASSDIVIVLTGNKIDLQEYLREVSREEAESYAKALNILYMETSAKLSTNIHHIFTEIAKRIPTSYLQLNNNETIRIPLTVKDGNIKKRYKNNNARCNC
ncbi:ras family-domain-containing protein [Cokeromyces recurvatus]|uniref:ras family-domain-containing protein n=1 Tax=Cokeromyces recurvatus TaxID=90255 RepID=UPI00221FD6EE|nr:ras family-domain-containing protein [Cokeromyces recurvatus]KAI7907994.1 ras family-domain-containing protein [Cokeromyces recurvatus]